MRKASCLFFDGSRSSGRDSARGVDAWGRMAFWPGSLSYNFKLVNSVNQGRSRSLRHADTLDGNETAVEKSGPWANLQARLIVQVEKPSCECEPVTVDK